MCRISERENILRAIRLQHPQYIPVTRKGTPFVDGFGCTWETPMEGMTGTEAPGA